MKTKKELTASLDGLEIGATGPNRLQLVILAEGQRVVLPLREDEAKWLAYALGHWAEQSKTIRSN